MKKIISLIAVLGLMVALTGCINVTVEDTSDDTSSTTTSDTSSGDTDWPDDFPVNSDWEVTGSSSSSYDTDVYLSMTQTCDDCTKEEVIEYYREVLGDEGWTEYSYSEYTSDFITDSGTASFDKGYDKYASVDYSVYDYGYGEPEIEIYLSYSEYYY